MGNAILKISNLRKTYYYLKKNGLKNAYYAALERMISEKKEDYHYEEPSQENLEYQRKASKEYPYVFSILVPAYETNPTYLQEMIDSVCQQSYTGWELIIADASHSRQVKKVMDTYTDERIRYIRLADNKGISENTNAALDKATGDYIGLLDHDDVLTPDALYEMAKAIHESEKNGKTAWMLYSDEDKGNGELTTFYEPHRKPELNVDLLLSNNYICHFLVMKRELMQELRFRPQYDGAQDYDLVLRAMGRLVYENSVDKSEINNSNAARSITGRHSVIHIPKVLYHWRCHTSSTAENPESKRYAYEAGKRALEDFLRARGWSGAVSHTKHLGFYHIHYEKGILAQRDEVGVVGARLLDHRGRIAGGIYDTNGHCPYEGLHKNFSGYMHRATLAQEAYAVDLRCMQIKEELIPLYKEVCGETNPPRITPNTTVSKENHTEIIRQSIKFCQKVREAGYSIVWLPETTEETKAQIDKTR